MLALISSLFFLFLFYLIYLISTGEIGGGRNPIAILILPLIVSFVQSYIVYLIKKDKINSSYKFGFKTYSLVIISGIIYYTVFTNWIVILVVPVVLLSIFL